MLPPATQDAQIIANLYNVVYVIAVLVFILVEGLLIYAAIKFRRRKNNENPTQVYGNNRAELAWTVIPAAIVAGVFFLSMDAFGQMAGRGTPTNQVALVHARSDAAARLRVESAEKPDLIIEVIGHQWYWEYKYKVSGGTVNVNAGQNDTVLLLDSSKPLVIPTGKTVRLDLTTADVIHAWWVPQFGPMIYVNPGENSYVFIKNAPVGTFQGQCNVYCGVRHAYMLSPVQVKSEADFDAWLKSEAEAQGVGAAAQPLQAGDAARGQQIFMGDLGGRPCWTCHSIDNTKAQAKVAPRTLNGFANYPTIAQVDGFTNNPDNLRKWLTEPQTQKPGTAMPNLGLKPQEVEDLIAYLTSLK
jgi:cytochrome c oxidase subunit II